MWRYKVSMRDVVTRKERTVHGESHETKTLAYNELIIWLEHKFANMFVGRDNERILEAKVEEIE